MLKLLSGLLLLAVGLSGCGGSRSPEYGHKGVGTVSEAERIVHGFSPHDRNLYAAGIKELKRTGSKPGRYTIAQILDQQQTHQDAVENGTYVRPTSKPSAAMVANANKAYARWRRDVQKSDPNGIMSEGHLIEGYTHDSFNHISIYVSEAQFNSLSDADRDRLNTLIVHLHVLWAEHYSETTGLKLTKANLPGLDMRKTSYYDSK